MGTAQEDQVRQTRELDVFDVLSAAGNELGIFGPLQSLPDVGHRANSSSGGELAERATIP
jgi:hypothetical protein